MRRNRLLYILLLSLLSVWLGELQAQSLQVALSPAPKVNRTTSGGTATIFFDSNIEDLSIVCTEEDPNESIVKINDHQWFVNIDVKKDVETDRVCYRNYLLKCSASAEYFLTTDEIAPNQVLYYTITLPNELEPKLQEEKARNVAKIANSLISDGDIYLAMTLLMEVSDSSKAIVPEVEAAMRKALDCYNAPGYKCVARLPHNGMVFGGDYNKDGSIIVTGAEDGYVRLWNALNGEYIKSSPRQNGFIYNVAYSTNSEQILFSSDTYSKLWNLNNDTFRQYDGGESSFVINDNYILTRDDNVFRIWDLKNSVCKKTLPKKGFSVGTLSPDGTYIYFATASSDFYLAKDSAYIVQYRAKDMQEISRFIAHTGTIHNMMFIGNNSLITGAYDGKVKLWNLHKKVAKAINTRSIVFDISKNSNSERIGISTDKNDALIWNIATNSIDTLRGHSQCVQALRFSPINNDVFTTSNDKTARIWHKENSKSDVVITKKGFCCYGSSSDGKLMTFGNYNDSIYIFNVKDKQIISKKSPYSDIRSIHLSEDKTHAIVTCGDMAPRSSTFIYDLNNSEVIDSTFNDMEAFQNLDFYSEFDSKNQYAFSIIGSSLTLWEMNNWKFSKCILEDWNRVIPSAAFSQSSIYFAYSYRNNDWHGVHILNLSTKESFDIQASASRDIDKIRFIGDDELLLVSDNDIELLNLRTKEICHNYTCQDVSFGNAIYLPNRKQIVGISSLASNNNRIVVWDKEDEKQLYSIPYNIPIEESVLIDEDLYIFGFGDETLHKLKLESYPVSYRIVKDIIGERVLTPEEKAKYNLE